MKAYEIITKQILDRLDKGVLPWNKTREGGLPCNFETKKEYKGINKLILLFDDFNDKRYLTFKQISKLGGTLKKGSVGTKVIYWKFGEIESEDSEQSELIKYPIIRYYNVFNVEQITGIDITPKVRQDNHLERYNKAQSVIEMYVDKPNIITGPEPYYNTIDDVIVIPNKNKFKSDDSYYSTLYHELIHSTGSRSRLNRFGDKVLHYGNDEYSFEELIAEIGTLFLSYEVGIINKIQNNSISYIHGWLKYLKNNKKEIIYASAKAQQAVDYIKCIR